MGGDTTPTRPVRVATGLWEAYARVCAQLGRTRAEDLNAYMRRQVRRHGDAEALRLLAEADAELKKRRSNKGGRPPAKS